MATLKNLLSWEPKLGLQDMTDTELLEFGIQRQADVAALSEFAAINPSSANVLLAIKDFQLKLNAQRPGIKATTEAKDMSRIKLEKIMTNYCNACFIICDGDKNLFLQTGFAIKKNPTPTSTVFAPTNISVNAGTSGQLIIKYRSAKKGRSYQVFVGTTPENMILVSSLTGRRLFINGLVAGKLYYIGLKTVGPKGLVSEMSSIVTAACFS